MLPTLHLASIMNKLKRLKARILGPQPAANPSSAGARSSSIDGPSDHALDVYEGIKTTLRLIKQSTDIFPMVKSPVAGLLEIIDIVEVGSFFATQDPPRSQ